MDIQSQEFAADANAMPTENMIALAPWHILTLAVRANAA